MIVATKGAHYSFENPGRSRVNREDIRADLDESLRTLGTEVIDFTGFTEMIRKNRWKRSWISWKKCRKKAESDISDFPITEQTD